MEKAECRDMEINGDMIEEIKPFDLPFDLDDKIFLIPCPHYGENIECDCIPEYESYNDQIKRLKSISGINEDLLS